MKVLNNKFTARVLPVSSIMAGIFLTIISCQLQAIVTLDRNPAYAAGSETVCAKLFQDSTDVGTPTNWEAYGFSDVRHCAHSFYLPNYYEIMDLKPDILTDPNPRTKIIKAFRDTAKEIHSDKITAMSKMNTEAASLLIKRITSVTETLKDEVSRGKYNMTLKAAGLTAWNENFIKRYLDGAYVRSVSAFVDSSEKEIALTQVALTANDLVAAERSITKATEQAERARDAAAKVPSIQAAQTEATRVTELALTTDAMVKATIAASSGGAGSGGAGGAADAEAKITKLINRATELKDQAMLNLKEKSLRESEREIIAAADIMLEVETLVNNMPNAKKTKFASNIKAINTAITNATAKILKEYSPGDIRIDFEQLKNEVERGIESAKAISNIADRTAAIGAIERKINLVIAKIKTLPNNILESGTIKILERNLRALKTTKTRVDDQAAHDKALNEEIYVAYQVFHNAKSGTDDDAVSLAISILQGNATNVFNMINEAEGTSPAMVLKIQAFVTISDNMQLLHTALNRIREATLAAEYIKAKIDDPNGIRTLIKKAELSLEAANKVEATKEIQLAKSRFLQEIKKEKAGKLLNQSDLSRFSTEINKYKDVIELIATNYTLFPAITIDHRSYPAGLPNIKDLAINLSHSASEQIRIATNPPTAQNEIEKVTKEIEDVAAAISGVSGGDSESKDSAPAANASSGGGGGAGAGADSRPVGNFDDVRREVRRLYENFNRELDEAKLKITALSDQLTAGMRDNADFIRLLERDLISLRDQSASLLLTRLIEATQQFFVRMRAEYAWTSVDIEYFARIETSLNGVTQNIKDLYKQIEDTALEKITIAIGVKDLDTSIVDIEKYIERYEAKPTTADSFKLENLKKSIGQVQAAVRQQITTDLENAKRSVDQIREATEAYWSTGLSSPSAIDPNNLAAIASLLNYIITQVQARFITKTDDRLALLRTRIERLKASAGSGETPAWTTLRELLNDAKALRAKVHTAVTSTDKRNARMLLNQLEAIVARSLTLGFAPTDITSQTVITEITELSEQAHQQFNKAFGASTGGSGAGGGGSGGGFAESKGSAPAADASSGPSFSGGAAIPTPVTLGQFLALIKPYSALKDDHTALIAAIRSNTAPLKAVIDGLQNGTPNALTIRTICQNFLPLAAIKSDMNTNKTTLIQHLEGLIRTAKGTV